MSNDEYDVYIKCDCGDVGHNIVLTKVTWDYEYKGQTQYKHDFGIHVRMADYQSFWQRLVIGFKYIFLRDRGNDYAEVVLNDESVDKLQKFIDDYKECNTKDKI